MSRNVANIERRVSASGKVSYRVRWSVGTGGVRSKTFARKKDAEQWLNQVKADRLRGTIHDPNRGKETLAEYAARWLEDRDLAPRSVELYESLLRRHILPTFGEHALSAVTIEEVRKWNAERRKNASRHSAAKSYRALRTILGTAEEDGLIPRTPCFSVGQVKSRPRNDHC